MESKQPRAWTIVYTVIILGGTLLLAFQHFNQFYAVIVAHYWEGLPFAEGGRWFYRSPTFFGYYSLAKAILYWFLFGLGLFAVLRHRPHLFRLVGTTFMAFYLLSYFLQLF